MRDKVSGKFERVSDEDYLKRVENRFEETFQLDLITFNGDNNDEKFFKIGITNTNLSTRYNKVDSLPYEYTKIVFLEGEAGEIWQLERDLLKLLVESKCTPKLPFAGMTECVVEDYAVVIKPLDLLTHENIIARKAKEELLKHFPSLSNQLKQI